MGTTEDIHTTCIFCGCGCGLVLHVNEGQILKASPEVHHPVSKGRLCVKGRHAWEFPGHEDRLRFPLVRKGGSLDRSSWREALSLSLGRLNEIKIHFSQAPANILTGWAVDQLSGTPELKVSASKIIRVQ
jgi:predicted molibdopterin-dependent oxidoreductase YjgC